MQHLEVDQVRGCNIVVVELSSEAGLDSVLSSANAVTSALASMTLTVRPEVVHHLLDGER